MALVSLGQRSGPLVSPRHCEGRFQVLSAILLLELIGKLQIQNFVILGFLAHFVLPNSWF